MWIRTQSKMSILKINAIQIADLGPDRGYKIVGDGSILGSYSSLAKCMEVLDYIQSHINIYVVNNEHRVFQMPQDSDVD